MLYNKQSYSSRQDKIQRINDMREDLHTLNEAKEILAESGYAVQEMALGAIIATKQREHDLYIAKHFPIVEAR